MEDYITRRIKNTKSKRIAHIYYDKNKNKINKERINKYINDLYIPPAYKEVKINLNKNDKVLAMGYDNKGRSQYIYNKKFIKGREKSKYKHMIDFGESYNRILKKIKKDLYLEGDSKNKQIAMALMLVIECGIRIGSEKYKNENNSFGATTLESRHIKINKDLISVNFIGKKGILNTGKVKNKKLSKNLRKKKKTLKKNDSIFIYRKENNWYKLKSTDVNKYLKRFGNFTSKNFRTWIANLEFIKELLKSNKKTTLTQREKDIKEALKKVADKLNNTPTVCRKNYIDPFIINIYLNNPKRYWETFKHIESKNNISEDYIQLLKSR